MKKELRQQVYEKYNGKCAYCGCDLNGKFQVDHIEPHWHNVSEYAANKIGIVKGSHDLDNLNPSCARCNKWKATYNIEQFRNEIAMQVKRLNAYSSNYRMAKDYGLIQETGIEVKFYFEFVNGLK